MKKSTEEKKEHIFEKESINKLFWKFFIPTLIGTVIFTLYIIIDGIFIKIGVGDEGISAVNLINPLFMTFSGTGLLFSLGGSILASIALSKNKFKESGQIFTKLLVFMTLLGIIICTSLYIFKSSVAKVLGASVTTFPLLKVYMSTMLLFVPVFLLNPLFTFFIRVDGAPKYATMLGVVGAIFNVVFDYIFVIIFKWGMFGAGLATGLGNVLSIILGSTYILKFSKFIKITKIRNIKDKLILKSCKLGLPVLINNFSIAFVIFITNWSIKKYLGDGAMAAYGAFNFISPMLALILISVGESVQPIISYNYGKKNYKRINQTLKLSLFIAMIIGVLYIFIGFIFKQPLTALFLQKGNDAYNISIKVMPILFSAFFFCAINITAINYLQSVTDAKKSIILVFLRGFIIYSIITILFPIMFGKNSIWFLMLGSEIITAIISITFILKSNKSLKKKFNNID